MESVFFYCFLSLQVEYLKKERDNSTNPLPSSSSQPLLESPWAYKNSSELSIFQKSAELVTGMNEGGAIILQAKFSIKIFTRKPDSPVSALLLSLHPSPCFFPLEYSVFQLNLLQVPAPCRPCFLLHKGSSTKAIFSSWPQVVPGEAGNLGKFLHQKGCPKKGCQALEQSAQGGDVPIPGGIWGYLAVLCSWLDLMLSEGFSLNEFHPKWICGSFCLDSLSLRECSADGVISRSSPSCHGLRFPGLSH